MLQIPNSDRAKSLQGHGATCPLTRCLWKCTRVMPLCTTASLCLTKTNVLQLHDPTKHASWSHPSELKIYTCAPPTEQS